MSGILYFEDFSIGESFEFGQIVLTEAQIRAYGRRFDPRPQHGGDDRDPAAAAAPTASPWQLCALLMRLNYDGWVFRAAAQGAPGVDAVRWLRPVQAGARLTARATILKSRVSRSRPQLGLVQFHYDILAGDREPVMSQTNYVMLARRAGDAPRPAPERDAEPPPERGAAPQGSAPPQSEAYGDPQPPRIALGSALFTADDILAFARDYDPQPFHVDEAAARNGPFGALAASGWHTAAAWMRAYVDTFRRGEAALPRPDRFLTVENLRWLRPVHAGDRVAFDFAPLACGTSARGEPVVTSRNRGINQHGVTVYEFTATMTVGAA